MRKLFVTLMFVAGILMAAGVTPRRRNTLGTHLHVDSSVLTVPVDSVMQPVCQPYDTVTAPEADSLLHVYDFAKPLRSRTESMRLTNHGALTLTRAVLTFSYSDAEGRLFHSRTLSLQLDIPAGETRIADIPSFDRQTRYRYLHTPAPKRTPSLAFTVNITPDTLIYRLPD